MHSVRSSTVLVGQDGAAQDSPLMNLLDNQRQKKDTRIFAHATAETQVAIKDLYNLRAHTKLPDTLIYGTNEPGFLEVFPRVASRPPKLLQELESILVDRLRSNDKAASVTTAIGSAKERDPKLSANLSLDAHRQVFNAFIAGFATYAPLLTKIQAEFDRALNEGVRCAQDNVEMRYNMANNEMARERAAAEARGQVLAEDLPFRAESLAQLTELTERAMRAEKKKTLAEKDLKDALAEEARLQALLQQLTEANAKLSAVVSEESKWVTQPISEHIKPLAVGPLTREDEEYLENELGAMLGGSSLDEGASSMRHQQQHAPSTSATGAPDQQASSSAPPAGAEASTPGPGVEPSAMSATTGGPASEAASPEPS